MKSIDIQKDIYSYCKGKNNNPSLVVLDHYKYLIYNIFEENINTAFPIAISFIDESIWKNMLEDFYENHPPKSAEIWKLAFEFSAYSIENHWDTKYNLPFLNELLSFECIETEMFMMDDIDFDKGNKNGDFENDVLIFSPEYQIISLKYPFHRLNPEEAILHAGEYHLLVYREHESKRVQFVEMNTMILYVINRLIDSELSLNIFIQTETELKDLFIAYKEKIISLLRNLHDNQFITGFKN